MKKVLKKAAAIFMALLIFSGGISVFAAEEEAGVLQGTILLFSPLEENEQLMEVPVGTPLEELAFPTALEALFLPEGTSDDTDAVSISVNVSSWLCSAEEGYNSGVEGAEFTFTPVLNPDTGISFSEEAIAPAITVRIASVSPPPVVFSPATTTSAPVNNKSFYFDTTKGKLIVGNELATIPTYAEAGVHYNGSVAIDGNTITLTDFSATFYYDYEDSVHNSAAFYIPKEANIILVGNNSINCTIHSSNDLSKFAALTFGGNGETLNISGNGSLTLSCGEASGNSTSVVKTVGLLADNGTVAIKNGANVVCNAGAATEDGSFGVFIDKCTVENATLTARAMNPDSYSKGKDTGAYFKKSLDIINGKVIGQVHNNGPSGAVYLKDHNQKLVGAGTAGDPADGLQVLSRSSSNSLLYLSGTSTKALYAELFQSVSLFYCNGSDDCDSDISGSSKDHSTNTAGLYTDSTHSTPYTSNTSTWSGSGNVLTLNGFNFYSDGGFNSAHKGLVMPKGSVIMLASGTINNISSGYNFYDQYADSSYETSSIALASKGSLIIGGGGVLNIDSRNGGEHTFGIILSHGVDSCSLIIKEAAVVNCFAGNLGKNVEIALCAASADWIDIQGGKLTAKINGSVGESSEPNSGYYAAPVNSGILPYASAMGTENGAVTGLLDLIYLGSQSGYATTNQFGNVNNVASYVELTPPTGLYYCNGTNSCGGENHSTKSAGLYKAANHTLPYTASANWSADGSTLTLKNFKYITAYPIGLELPAGTTIKIDGISMISAGDSLQEKYQDTDYIGLHCNGGDLTIIGQADTDLNALMVATYTKEANTSRGVYVHDGASLKTLKIDSIHLFQFGATNSKNRSVGIEANCVFNNVFTTMSPSMVMGGNSDTASYGIYADSISISGSAFNMVVGSSGAATSHAIYSESAPVGLNLPTGAKLLYNNMFKNVIQDRTVSYSPTDKFFRIDDDGSVVTTMAVQILSPAPTPTISQQPVGNTYEKNDTATALSVNASASSGTLSYQWYSNTSESNKGGSIIAGATSASYTPPTDTLSTTYYYVVISNKLAGYSNTSVNSNAVKVVVKLPDAPTPSISRQPTGGSYNKGDTPVPLKVTASVTEGSLSYQWYSNTTNTNSGGTAITGATSSSYTPATSASGKTYYYVVVTNSMDGKSDSSFASNTVAVDVKTPGAAQAPVLNTQLEPGKYAQNSAVIPLSVNASVQGDGTLSYQWYSSQNAQNSGGKLIEGAVGSSYQPPTNSLGTVYYYVVVTNTNNAPAPDNKASVTSNSVAVEVVAGKVDHSPIKAPEKGVPVANDTVLDVSFKGELANLKNVRINGVDLDTAPSTDNNRMYIIWPGKPGAYCGEIRSGSVEITLYKDYIASLPSGSYLMEALFIDDGVISSGELSFIIPAAENTIADSNKQKQGGAPQTGDYSNLTLFIILFAVSSLLLIALIVFYQYKKRKAGKQ